MTKAEALRQARAEIRPPRKWFEVHDYLGNADYHPNIQAARADRSKMIAERVEMLMRGKGGAE